MSLKRGIEGLHGIYHLVHHATTVSVFVQMKMCFTSAEAGRLNHVLPLTSLPHLGYCPPPRGPIKGYIHPYYNYYPTVTEGGGEYPNPTPSHSRQDFLSQTLNPKP